MKKISLFLIIQLLFFQHSNSQNISGNTPVQLQIDGAKKYQQMDGFGVNINTAWWYNGDYEDARVVQPAIDMLVDSLGATIFRAVIEEIDWEAVNDDKDPNNFNWNYYNKVFSNTKFQGVWNTLRYLNRKGITDGLIISLMGGAPAAAPLDPKDKKKSWMGGTDYTIDPAMEDEFVESIAAMLYYARHTAKAQFTLVSPMNETDVISGSKSAEHPDGIVEGPNMPDAVQFIRVIKKLAKKLDAIGMSDIRFVAPDAAGDHLFASCLDEMVKDSYLMSKLVCWGVHNYSNDADNYQKIVSRPANLNKSYWVTEIAGIDNLFGQIDDNPTAFLFWDGFDCVYQHARRNGYGSIPPNDWVFWIKEQGKPLIAYNPEDKNWVPRKQFYEYAQLFKFLKPGASRIATSIIKDTPAIYAFVNPNMQLVIVGRNSTNVPITVNGKLLNLPKVNSLEMFFTDSLKNLCRTSDITIADNSFSVTIPANSVFTLAEKVTSTTTSKTKRYKPEPLDWYAGDMHVHRDCGGPVEGILPESKFIEMMAVNDLAVISVLADNGDAEVKPSEVDLLKVNGKDYHLSIPGRTIHYDAEWHFDPAGTTFEHKALGGHVVLLGLTEAHQIWDESPYEILEYGRAQGGIVGFCHTEYLNDAVQNDLNCCIPIEYPVEAALGTCDFFSEDVYGSISQNNGNYNADATINAYYKMLNCGIRLGLCAGTDFPCNANEPFGTLLTYVQVDGDFTYRKWIEGIRDGKTVVARNGHEEFIDLKVNKTYQPGDDIQFKKKGKVAATIKWTSIKPLTGRLELVYNGKVIASKKATATPDLPIDLEAGLEVEESGWLCARRMDENGHQTHTAPIYLTVNNAPVRASVDDAMFFVGWIDNLIEKTSPGNDWNKYFSHDLDVVQGRYKNAKSIYLKIAEEAKAQNN
ncbi:hypothetical protein AQPE_2766 [Aquipluma nitroreducens]|uniref:Uncharacterized protein n=1 Tax=Aquipluma nitroreducens TaxID=2010828 RepID=A0A5K7SAJ5_9BACT|nr:CehA/McbA family metallohydrolase [Aquipluma nitroreducens]BBE18603.1 hypothetical protein AQPE_2766 [Aquipluma nitroreducens]